MFRGFSPFSVVWSLLFNRKLALMRWSVSSGGRGAKQKSVWWRCCSSCWPPASTSLLVEVYFLLRSSQHFLVMSLQAVFCFDRKEVSFSAQQAGQMPEGLHQEEFGECFLLFSGFISTIPAVYLSNCLFSIPLSTQPARSC